MTEPLGIARKDARRPRGQPQQLKYAGLLVHDLRRTGARNLRRAGVAEGVIMQIGGWRTHSVFDRYAIITENDIADAVRKLDTDRKQREAVAIEIARSHDSVTNSPNPPTLVAKSRAVN